ncbi:MAG: hypothetical protein IPL35_14990 [Sphingobacteriales bacterium]|nr:hypothetical protein [Sphingobacteriales bacterium]
MTYQRDSINRPDTCYEILYEKEKKYGRCGQSVREAVSLCAGKSENGTALNPSANIISTKDIFTHISSIPQPDETENGELLSEG